MPKHDAFSPKAIANMIKAKGLQKLKWYCEMCEKQCRDENGFKCHKMSESHQRQMKLFAANPGRYMNSFSRQFEQSFVDILSRQGGRRVKANDVYQELIKDRHHVHMNSTIWTTLTQFVYYLGKKGIATVDEGELIGDSRNGGQARRQLYIQYINRDPNYLIKKEKLKEMNIEQDKQRKYQENHIKKLLKKQSKILNNGNNNDVNNNYQASKLERSNDSMEKISFSFGSKDKKDHKDVDENKEKYKEKDNETQKEKTIHNKDENKKKESEKEKHSGKKRRWDDIGDIGDIGDIELNQIEREKKRQRQLKEKEKEKEKQHEMEKDKDKDKESDELQLLSKLIENSLILPDIVLKILKGKYKQRKGKVIGFDIKNSKLMIKLQLLGDKKNNDNNNNNNNIEIFIKEKNVETVIPKYGSKVKILKHGKYRNQIGIIQTIEAKKYRAIIKLDQSNHIVKMKYENFSKLSLS